jgi:hypothetical protein
LLLRSPIGRSTATSSAVAALIPIVSIELVAVDRAQTIMVNGGLFLHRRCRDVLWFVREGFIHG